MEGVVKEDHEFFSRKLMRKRVADNDDYGPSVRVNARKDVRIATGDARERRRKFDADDRGKAKFRGDKKGPPLATSKVQKMAMLRIWYCS
jgi:hypothetical protein